MVVNEHFIELFSVIGFSIAIVLVILLMFHLASKFVAEDFDSFDYTVVTVLMFITVSISYIAVSSLFHVLIFRYGVLSIDDVLRVNGFMFIAYSLILFVPAVLIVRHTFMYIRTRMIVAFTFSVMLSFLMTYFTGV